MTTKNSAALINWTVIGILSVIFSWSGTASAEGYAGYAGAFLRMGAGAVSVAGGDAGVARSMGIEQTNFNAAGLPYASSSEAHFGYHFLSLDRKLLYNGVLYQVPRLESTPLLKPAAVALTWTHAGTDNIDGRDRDGNPTESLGYFENRFAASFGLKFHRSFSAGVTLGVLYALFPHQVREDDSALTSTTFGADIGVQVRPFLDAESPLRLNTLVLGAAAYGLLAKNSWNTTGVSSQGDTRVDDYPHRFRAGFSYRPLAGVETFLDLETDFEYLLLPKGGVEVGLFNDTGEKIKSRWTGGFTGLVLRAGMDRDRPAFGFGVGFRLFGVGSTRLDYAYVLEPVSPEATQVVSWRFLF